MRRDGGTRTSANPIRDLFDACAHGHALRFACRGCRRTRIFAAAAAWHHFRRKGFPERLREVPGRFRCGVCGRHGPSMELVREPPDDHSLPMPTELDLKRELRRRR
jgi:hypothetical protein